MALVERVDEDWDEKTTGNQIMSPDWDFSPIRMRTMHHLPHIFFDTLRPERPDCPVLIPSSFSRSRDRIINLDIYSYEPCGLPTGNFMPAEKSQIRLMTLPSHCAHAYQRRIKLRLNRPTSRISTFIRRRCFTHHSFLVGAQSLYLSIEMQKSCLRLMIGLPNYLKGYSDTFYHFNRDTLSGILRMCAT